MGGWVVRCVIGFGYTRFIAGGVLVPLVWPVSRYGRYGAWQLKGPTGGAESIQQDCTRVLHPPEPIIGVRIKSC